MILSYDKTINYLPERIQFTKAVPQAEKMNVKKPLLPKSAAFLWGLRVVFFPFRYMWH